MTARAGNAAAPGAAPQAREAARKAQDSYLYPSRKLAQITESACPAATQACSSSSAYLVRLRT
jgi:hypothetical protein